MYRTICTVLITFALLCLGPHLALAQDDDMSAEERAYMDEIFDRFGVYSHKHGVPVVVAYLARISTDPHELKELVTKHALHFVDASILLAKESSRGYIISRLDDHPNGKAHELLARPIYDYIKAAGLL